MIIWKIYFSIILGIGMIVAIAAGSVGSGAIVAATAIFYTVWPVGVLWFCLKGKIAKKEKDKKIREAWKNDSLVQDMIKERKIQSK